MVPLDPDPFGEGRERRVRRWLAVVLAIFVGSIVYGLVTGEGSGPG